MGQTQEAWLSTALKQKSARWNALAQQVMMMPLDRRTGDELAPIRNMDSWGGYDAPRERVLKMVQGLDNMVVLTGDEHQNYAGVLRTQGGQGDAVAVEFVGTSITSGGDGADRRVGEDRLRARNPFLAWTNDRRGYLLCDVDADQWKTEFRTVDTVTRPDGMIKTSGTAIVEHGRAAVTVT
ncbi:alkaline phosphatase D family protein [Sphingomonas aurantiaca]